MTEPPVPMQPVWHEIDLDAIRARDLAVTDYRTVDVQQVIEDRRALLAEVDLLRDDLELVKRYGKTGGELADEAEQGYDVSKMKRIR